MDATRAPDPITYLDEAAASAPGREYKQRLHAALELRPGHTVLDVGCGPGTDLAVLAVATGDSGAVIGVDHDPAMVEAARLRLAGYGNVTVHRGDAHALPLADSSVDRARADRVLQHLADPAWAIVELRRVVRTGGIVGLAEPDWDSFIVDDIDAQTSRAFGSFLAGRVRNPTIGRQLPRLLEGAGFALGSVVAHPVLLRDFGAADQILGLRRNTARAVEAGALDDRAAGQWLDRLGTGPFLAGFTFFTVIARAGD
ncbi:MAG: ubiquinone biosynthesis protein UbiE [Actinobacteria bacterium 13_2_20CM_2_71_6]|nr:MAG: ubiquinone biosynthesis protein UbiE [Actinobacteria bacterium 13_2_20CM_2_71_6]